MAQKSHNTGQSDGPINNASSSSLLSSSSSTPSATAKDPSPGTAERKRSTTPSVLNGPGSASSTVLPKMSDPGPLVAPSTTASQPMEKSASNGSSRSSKEPATGTASPYGTRSRNRTGTSRINYAEDKDLDVDIFEMYPERRDEDSKKSSSRQPPSSSASQSQSHSHSRPASGGSSRKPLPTEDRSHHHPSSHTATREQSSASTPAPSNNANSAASHATTAASRKRKAASQTSAASSQPPPPAAGHAATLQKRLGAVSQQRGNGYGETNLLTFEACGAKPKDGKMVADDGTVLATNDHVYLICEPPGEPYYLARIMEFLHRKNNPKESVDALRINWYYRPKDIGRKVQDTRLVFATMHSDICPLTSLRGKCQIRHKAEIASMTEYKRSPDCFWYEKLYDRYIQKNYEVIPTEQIVNVPERVKKVLDERWKYILVEQGRGKELTSAVKLCKRCSGYCASNDSVDCAVCQNTYHMNCVRPPLLKKPSRGFAWSCAACSRAQERKLEARNTPNLVDSGIDAEEEEYVDDDDDDHPGGTGGTTPADDEHHEPATAEQIYHASLWPYRYLGIHCKPEDALDYDDRIFPRASTRLGPRHQATVTPWPGKPVEYVKPLEIKKTGRKDGKLSKEVQAALEQQRIEREKRPKWVQDEPPGYVARGEDGPQSTATLLWKPPADCPGVDMSDAAIDDYMEVAKSMATSLGLPKRSTNLQDVARDVLFEKKFDAEKALSALPKLDASVFKEPELTPAEQKKFEEGVQKYGSELHSVRKHVKTVSAAHITRYYYAWKKTERGRQVWGSFAARKGKKEAKKAEATASKLADDVADTHDDSAFDADRAAEKKKGFVCKFCSTKSSRQWRRAPNASTLVTESGGSKASGRDRNGQYIVALCRRCAELWRRYAIQWEDVDEVARKVAQTGGRGWRRRVDEELYKELLAADEMISNTRYRTPDGTITNAAGSTNSTGAAATATAVNGQHPSSQEPPRKKLKGSAADKDPDHVMSDSGPAASKKKDKTVADKAAPPAAPPPPPVPEIPKPKTMPCAICQQIEPLNGDQHLSCRDCRMTVHRNCYGIVDNRAPGKWTCDMCLNDKNPQVSLQYKCVLCPVEHTEHDFVEPPRPSHKKKTEKEREREKAERENAHRAAAYYRKRQEEMNKPVDPREPLKRTADNNWVHVTCAVWTPEVKFGLAKALGPSEGIPSIPRARYAETCKVCKSSAGACVACHECRAPVHVECAHQAGYLLGFDIHPVKSSRRDQFNIVTINGESGTMSAAIWCKEHMPTKTIVHNMQDAVDESGLNALQLYAQHFKQADLTLTGCARKANQISLATAKTTTTTASEPHTQLPNNRRGSTAGDRSERGSPSPDMQSGGKVCLTCGIDVSPKWYPAVDQTRDRASGGLINGHYGTLGAEAQKFVEQRSFQCHKCKKTNRQPKPRPCSRDPPSPRPEPVRYPSQGFLPDAPSPSPLAPEARHAGRHRPFAWSPPPPHLPTTPISGPPPSLAAPLQPPALGPISGPIAPPPHPPPVGPPPRDPAPMPAHPSYHQPGAAAAPYGDWHRSPPTPHGPRPASHPHREVNGGPPLAPNPMPPLAPPNHLRPPPISSLAHPPMHSGHGPPPPTQPPPYANGLPPSPRHLGGHPAAPPMQNGASSYAQPPPPPPPPSYHHQSRGSPDYANGSSGQPPLHSILRHRTPLSTPHGSPPAPRDSLPLSREPSNPPAQRENRPASGASASPSLRNLLS